MSTRGYFGIGIYQPKKEANVGILLRSAYCFGANFVFTVGARYQKVPTDTPKVARHVPLFHFENINDCIKHLPDNCPLVGIEQNDRACNIHKYVHNERCAYLLGAEDFGIPKEVLNVCNHTLEIPGTKQCLNVSVAGSIVIFDRLSKSGK